MLGFSKKQDGLEEKLAKYQDSEGVSTAWLNFGLWYIRHRKYFFLSAVTILVLLAIALYGYSAYYFGDYVLRGMNSQKIAMQGLSENLLQSNKVDYEQNTRFEFVKVLSLGQNRYDLVGSFTNANEKFLLKFDYYFVVDGNALEKQSGLAYPQEKKYLLALNQSLSDLPSSAELKVENMTAQRLDQREISDWNVFKNDRLNFPILDKEFKGYEESGLSESLKLNSLNFQIENQTAYSYYQMPLNIIIFNNQDLSAVTRYIANDFNSRERRQVSLSLLGQIYNVTDILIQPDLDILDSVVFKVE